VAGLKVARVLAIRDGGDGSPMMQMEPGLDRAAPQAPPPPVLAGTSMGVVSTTVDFVLSPR
jgi:hypothetical protein